MLSEISHKMLRGTLRGLYYFFQILKSSAKRGKITNNVLQGSRNYVQMMTLKKEPLKLLT